MRIMIGIIAALASFTATAQEVCDASIARGGWIIEAPYLGASCIGVLEPLDDNKAIAMFECGNAAGGSQPVGQAKIEYGDQGDGCVMHLEIGSYSRTVENGHDGGQDPQIHWACGYCDDNYDPYIDTLDLSSACEGMGLNLGAQNNYQLINTIIVNGYTPPGDTSVIEQGAVCGWTYQLPGGGTTYTPMSTSATCRDVTGGHTSASLCEGSAPEEWIENYAHIVARVPIGAGETVTEDLAARVTVGQVEGGLTVTYDNTVILTRTTAPVVTD